MLFSCQLMIPLLYQTHGLCVSLLSACFHVSMFSTGRWRILGKFWRIPGKSKEKLFACFHSFLRCEIHFSFGWIEFPWFPQWLLWKLQHSLSLHFRSLPCKFQLHSCEVVLETAKKKWGISWNHWEIWENRGLCFPNREIEFPDREINFPHITENGGRWGKTVSQKFPSGEFVWNRCGKWMVISFSPQVKIAQNCIIWASE